MKKIRLFAWGSLFAGALAGVGLNFLLNLFALAVGFASFTVSQNGTTSFSGLGFSFFVCSALIAMFCTGWVAGILMPKTLLDKRWGFLFGFIAWCLLLIFTIILITNFIQYGAFHSNFTSNLVEIKLKNDSPMLTSTVAHSIKNSPLSFNIEVTKKVITVNAFLTFFLFFIGAIASSIGGFIGYSKTPKTNQDSS